MWKSACVWLLQKIAGSFPVWNEDDLHTDRFRYKKLKSTDAVFAKIKFLLSKFEIMG